VYFLDTRFNLVALDRQHGTLRWRVSLHNERRDWVTSSTAFLTRRGPSLGSKGPIPKTTMTERALSDIRRTGGQDVYRLSS